MNDKQLEVFSNLFNYIYKGDMMAVELSFQLLHIAHTWDDLIDKDKPVDDVDINKAFINSLFTMQNNPLWHQCGLNHHVLNVFLRWRDATAIETDSPSDDDLNKCYMLRAGLYDIFVILAYYIGGDAWAAEVGPLVRKTYGEKLVEYKEEMNNA